MRFLNTTKKYDDFNEEIKNGSNEILDFLRNFVGNNNIEDYNYFMKCLKCYCLNIKIDIAMILRGIKRIGKSTISKIIRGLIGEECCLNGNEELILSPFNMSMKGKSIVFFEEIQPSSKTEMKGGRTGRFILSVSSLKFVGACSLSVNGNRCPERFGASTRANISAEA